MTTSKKPTRAAFGCLLVALILAGCAGPQQPPLQRTRIKDYVTFQPTERSICSATDGTNTIVWECSNLKEPRPAPAKGFAGKKAAGRLLDGVEHNGFPRRA